MEIPTYIITKKKCTESLENEVDFLNDYQKFIDDYILNISNVESLLEI